jgi:CRP/FNR family transcriptional regulator
MFVDLSKRDLLRLAATCRQRDYAAGDTLVQQGQPGAGLYVIVSGRVRVTQRAADGTTRELSTLGPSDVFGELALFDDDDTYRTATVTALEPTRVLIVPVFDFRVALREDPDIGIRLLAVLSRRLRRAESQQV